MYIQIVYIRLSDYYIFVRPFLPPYAHTVGIKKSIVRQKTKKNLKVSKIYFRRFLVFPLTARRAGFFQIGCSRFRRAAQKSRARRQNCDARINRPVFGKKHFDRRNLPPAGPVFIRFGMCTFTRLETENNYDAVFRRTETSAKKIQKFIGYIGIIFEAEGCRNWMIFNFGKLLKTFFKST